jgi:phenylacetate-CoA ligase
MGFGNRMFDLRTAVSSLNESQYWSSDKIEQYQYEKLRELLNYCYTNVTYYQCIFAEAGFVPNRDFNRVSDINKIPLMTKQTAREVRPLLFPNYQMYNYITEKTSGSTGEPFKIDISNNQIAFEKATVWRHWGWAGYKFRTPMAIIRTYVPKSGQPLIRHDRIRNFRYYSAYHLNEENGREYLRDIQKFGAKFIRGYPASISIMAKIKMNKRIDLPRVRGILTASETLTDTQRETIESAFNARIFNWYGLAEQVVTANECESHMGMHLNQEYGYWELEKRDYLSDNQRMIIGTNFRNYAMPLLRYETGDIATLSDISQCSCGRSLPLIEGIAGRKDDIITTPDGTRIPSVNFYSMFREFPTVDRFQIIQWSIQDIEIRVQSNNFTSKEKEDIRNELKQRLGNKMKIKLTLNSEFEKNPEGKRRPVISLVKIEEANETDFTV